MTTVLHKYIYFVNRLKMEEKKKALTEIIINNKKELTIKEEKRKLGYNKPKRNKKKNENKSQFNT